MSIFNRIVVVGHKWSLPSSWTDEDSQYTGKRDNTKAIIGTFDPNDASLKYDVVRTNIEVRDKDGKLIDHENAADVNCVIRIYDNYYLATRKGIAALYANGENLYQPVLNPDKSRYFIPTKGSCKFVYDAPGDDTRMYYLYLAEDKENIKGQSSIAKLAEFKVATGNMENGITPQWLMNEDTHETIYNTSDFDINNYLGQIELPELVSPIDGKNGICVIDNAILYASLGTGGLYYKQPDPFNSSVPEMTDVIKFGNRPVNFVYAEDGRSEGYHRGYVYVANGSRLTILDRASMKEVASYNLSAKNENEDNLASANYIHVDVSNEGYPFRERTITVAYGQAGVRIFKFMPKQSPAFPS